MNLDVYADGINAITALAFEPALDPRAVTRAARRGLTVELVIGDARQMPLADASFDTVVCTFLLCSISDGAAAVREFRRVLRPEGRLLFLEHVLRRAPIERALQQVLNPLSLLLSCGCSLIRDSASTIANNGFLIEELNDRDLPAMLWPHRRVIRGTALPIPDPRES